MYQTDLYDVVLGVAVVRPHPLLEEHAQREVLLEQGQHLLDRDADGSQDSRLCPLFAWCYLKGIANILLKSKLFRISLSLSLDSSSQPGSKTGHPPSSTRTWRRGASLIAVIRP